jgi:hypothetical protein
MARPTLPPLQRQLLRVRRRLFVQSVLNTLAIGWTLSLVVAAGWVASEPHVLSGDNRPLLRWGVVGGLLALATITAIIRSVLRRPSPVSAALAIDERFGLKERVTTSISLSPADQSSPAAVALLQDVNSRVD